MKFQLLLFFLICQLCVFNVIAQGADDSTIQTVDKQLWLDYNYSVKLNDKLSLVGDGGLRGSFDNSDWKQVIFRPGVRYNFNKIFSIAGSLAGFFTFNIGDYNVSEFRITTDANVSWPDLKVINFSYRFRIENRTFIIPNEDNILNNFRFRFLLSINSRQINVFSEKRSIYFQAQYEPFYTPPQNGDFEIAINQTRIHAIFGHRISSGFGYDIQYIWQQTRASSLYQLRNTQNIIRIRFYQRF